MTKRVQIGRSVKTLPAPNPTTRERARTKRKLERADAEREQRRQQAEAELQRADAEHAQRCRDIVMLHAGQIGLTGPSVSKLANVVENQRRAHIRAGGQAKSFDPYGVIKHKLPDLGIGVAPRAKPAAPPPMPLSDRGSVATDAERQRLQERRELNHDRGRRMAEQQQADREAYEAALKRHGLSNPSNPRSGSGTSGLGM